MSKSSATQRVILILKDLNNGKKLNLTNLSYAFDVSERTIRRDFELIETIFDDGFLIKEKKNYSTVKKTLLTNVLNGTELVTLTHIINMFEVSGSKLLDKKLQNNLKDNNQIYLFNNKPFEYLNNLNVVKNLENAIKYKQKIKITYHKNNKEKIFILKPYKITLLNENFYLLSIDHNDQFLFSRISRIKNVKLENKTFYHKPEVNSFINKIQTPWAKNTGKYIKIKIKVKSHVSKYFKNKKFFISQKILEELENGELLIEYEFTNFQEIEDFIIKWLPNIEIINPIELKDYIKNIMIKKLNNLS